MYKLGKKSKRELIGVHPILAFAVMEAIKITEQDFTVFDGLRTLREQRKYVREGKSHTMKSKHLSGNAVDIIPYVEGKLTWEGEYFDDIEIAMKSVIKTHALPIEWGFDLWEWDKPHWQIKKGYDDYDVRKFAPHLVVE